jgi:phytoene desaturase
MPKEIIIAGAGLAGMASALRLAKRGYKVTILEKNSSHGGRLNQIKKDGFTFDTGPSFFSMSYEFQAFADDCGIELPFKYHELDVLYTVHFSDTGKMYRMYRDIAKLSAQFADCEPNFHPKMQAYLSKSKRVFDDTIDLVVKRNFESKFDYFINLLKVNPVHIPLIIKSFWSEICTKFNSREAREVLSLVAFFMGRTPFDTMGIYTMLSYTEFVHDGYYNVNGGMYRIAQGIADELGKAGVKICYDTEVVAHESKDGKLDALISKDGHKWRADAFIANADAAVFRGSILGRRAYSVPKLDKMEWTMGYLTMYIGIDCKLNDTDHHNYYIDGNLEKLGSSIVKGMEGLDSPYYYVNVLSKHNDDCAPQGCESLFFVCPVPHLLHKPDWSDKDTISSGIIRDFSKRIGKDLNKHIVSKTIFTPEDWQSRFNFHRGSGLGLAHTLGQIGGLRPANTDEEYENLFYAGASTVPGAGLPMVIISSKLACERIYKYYQ